MKVFLLVMMIILFQGCSQKNKSAGDILPQEKMTKIIWDIIQVDEYASAFLIKDSTKNIKRERMKLYQQVFQLHNVSKEVFNTSFKYYSGRPDVMKVLFDTLGARAERERQNVYAPKDSLP